MREPPARLGRGLAMLLGPPADGGPDAQDGSLCQISLASVRPNPRQPRRDIDNASLHELARSIGEHGILQPLLVRGIAAAPGVYEIVAGERRWRAAQLAGLQVVPCIVRSFPDRAASAATLVENLQRTDLNPIEEASGFRRMMIEFSLTQEDVAQLVGKSRSHVANALRLLGLPDPVREHVTAGRLSAGHARALLSSADPAMTAAEVMRRDLNVRQTEDLVAGRTGADRSGKTGPVDAPSDLDSAALESELSRHLGLRVQVQSRGARGRLVLIYETLDQLDGLVQLLHPT